MENTAARYSAHIGYLFTDLPFGERVRAAKRHGFSAVEYPAPYDTPASVMAEWLAETGLPYVQFGLRSGDPARGEKGLTIFPERREEFRASVEDGLSYAETVGVRLLHAMAGVLPQSARTPDHWRQYIENLSYAADAAEQKGVTILVEPMCQQAVPDYFIQTPDRAEEAIAATGRKNIRM
jgi:hydroxypyruvate isomerase